ncbi:predicted protein [Verticillium alfalfae VaMs.102]|uniref:Predicted protein n=1 Tax=Verticillium alfalfae (strain VaMs.102 / ATCC MYA-4576 / FGSC 10136) TaxID=526221 RepID=C9SRG1_VERA1|nr:predicted protein [Verticillium alfalfae VaMs.102]EEY21376.1 predicted protein [Verticillium alfalfae VaMs.102]
MYGRNKTKVKPGTTRDPAATPQWTARKSQNPVQAIRNVGMHRNPASDPLTRRRAAAPKRCPRAARASLSSFLPSSLGSPEPYVTARAVIDPDYHGDPLLSNALVPTWGTPSSIVTNLCPSLASPTPTTSLGHCK